MFRDSRGVVHTVCSPDPLDDVPPPAGQALARALLRPVDGDLGGALEQCDAVRELLDRWQDAFFAALPHEIDLDEEARWAAEAGLSLDDIESSWEEEDWDDEDDRDHEAQSPGQIGLEEIDLTELTPLDGEPVELFDFVAPEHSVLPEDVVAELERALLLLPLRVRLEALVAAGSLVDEWGDLLADHEKLLGHLVLAHEGRSEPLAHEELADLHAALHAGEPGHSMTGP